MDLFAFNPAQALSLLLTLIRVSLLVFLLPVFGGNGTPRSLKACICLAITAAIWPQVSFPGEYMPAHPLAIAIIVFGELILGLIFSLVVRFIFGGIQVGGQILAFQMGFSMATTVDPLQGDQETIISHFLYMVAILTFLILNGHLYVLKALMDSFRLIPPGGLIISPPLGWEIISMSAEMFVLGLKVAAPVMASLFLVELALALMARAAPQMNMLIIGFPVKITIGLFFLGMLFVLMAEYIQEFIFNVGPLIHNLLRAASPFNS